MPRVFMGAFIGILLATCGVVMQATVQNPLADPYILGISSGASLGATFSIMIGASAVFSGVLAALHDLNLTLMYSTYVYVLKDGIVVAE